MALRLVNMIPAALSGETFQDSEPNLAVDPANPLRIAGSAFTPDPAGGANAPIFVSTDGGNTWALNNIVPSQTVTGDITVRFGGTSGILYTGILRRPVAAGSLRLTIARAANFTAATLMTVLVDRTANPGPDQPYVQAATVMGGAGVGRDRVYVGNNDRPVAGGGTATIDQSLDGANATPPPPSGFTLSRLEVRANAIPQDAPPIRPAIHPDGTIYAVFHGLRVAPPAGGNNWTCDLVIVRDDGWGAGAPPFNALFDPPAPAGDGLRGRRIAQNLTIPFNTGQALGQERLVMSNLSVAIDPRNSSTVYVAWADLQAGTYTLHVRRSVDRGANWSADLRTVASATNPALAINSRGKVAFLYQQLTAAPNQRWVTHLELTTDDWTTVTDRVLTTMPANAPVRVFGPYLGDYVHVLAVGKDFYGVHSANNTAPAANFPNGVTFARNRNAVTGQLLANDGVTPVAASIDPYFFAETEIDTNVDFYVRDWTDSAVSGDTGLEPSTHAVFYITSDVWNRLADAPGGFNPNDQPINEWPAQGTGTAPNNYAFARIRRNASGIAATVTARFLVSPLGTGSNYQLADTAPDPSVAFAAADLVQTPSPGYPWHQNPVTTTHVCLAVEISTAADPIVAPSLLGRAPGWPAQDLDVLCDNNKAQRNMYPPPVGGDGDFTIYALVHNAALVRRSIIIRYEVPGRTRELLGDIRLGFVGQRRPRRAKADGDLVLEDMEPGENRWILLIGQARDGDGAEPPPVVFQEMVGNTPVNGFAIAPTPSPRPLVIAETLRFHAAVLFRMAAGFGHDRVVQDAERAQKLSAHEAVTEDGYLEYLRDTWDRLQEACRWLIGRTGGQDPFRLVNGLRRLDAALGTGSFEPTAPAHLSLMNGLDAFQTMAHKADGDVADILQTVEWQRQLYATQPPLQALDGTSGLIERSESFAEAYRNRRIDNDAYPGLIAELMPVLEETAGALSQLDLKPRVAAIAESTGSLTRLQRTHREFLLALASLEG